MKLTARELDEQMWRHAFGFVKGLMTAAISVACFFAVPFFFVAEKLVRAVLRARDAVVAWEPERPAVFRLEKEADELVDTY